MKFLMSFHTGYWYSRCSRQNNPGRKNPKYFELYGAPHDENVRDIKAWKNHIEKQTKFNTQYRDLWLAKMEEAVSKYSPIFLG